MEINDNSSFLIAMTRSFRDFLWKEDELILTISWLNFGYFKEQKTASFGGNELLERISNFYSQIILYPFQFLRV